MRPETRDKLDEIERAERNLNRLAAGLGLVLTIAFAAWFLRPSSNDQRVTATVRAARLVFDEETGRRWFNVESKLETGKIVMATSAFDAPPPNNARIVLRQRPNLLGFTSYVWEGQRAVD